MSTPEAARTEANQAVATALLAALRSVAAIPPVTAQLGDDLDAAYAAQELVIASLEGSANPRVGRKVGLTSPAVQAQLGVDQPDFGVLLANMEVQDGATIDSGILIAPKVEAEVAFVMAEDVNDPSPEAVLAAVDYMVAALEVVDSRIADWNITIVDTVADNASAGLYVLGTERKTLQQVDPKFVEMEMTINGAVASTGNGEACLGDPRNALVWVAQTAIRLGRPLRAGEVVLSGALGPMALLPPGSEVTATISGLGSVSATTSKE